MSETRHVLKAHAGFLIRFGKSVSYRGLFIFHSQGKNSTVEKSRCFFSVASRIVQSKASPVTKSGRRMRAVMVSQSPITFIQRDTSNCSATVCHVCIGDSEFINAGCQRALPFLSVSFYPLRDLKEN